MLGHGVVDRHDGEQQHALLGHGAQANDSGGGFLGSSDHARGDLFAAGMKRVDQIGAVVHCHLGLMVERGGEVRVVALVVLSLDGVNRNAVVADQGGRDVILGGKRIRRAQHHIRAAVPQRDRKVGCLCRYVQTARNADTFQRLPLDEFFAD